MSANACVYCGKDFTERDSGGKRQRFCSSACRVAFHRGARAWALEQLEACRVTAAEFRRAGEAGALNALPATYTLPPGAASPNSVPAPPIPPTRGQSSACEHGYLQRRLRDALLRSWSNEGHRE